MADRSSILPSLRHEVALAIHAGHDADAINEAIIEPATISDEAKAALWLYAWSMQEPGHQRRAAAEHLDYLDGTLTLPSGD